VTGTSRDVSSTLELDHASMQRIGHQVADFVAAHLASLRDQPAFSTLDRASARALVYTDAPAGPTPFDELLKRFGERVVPHHAREPHPRFLGYIPSCPTFPAMMGDWLAAGFNFFSGVYTVAAGPNEVELTVLEWFRQWMGMPEGTRGLLTSGGSAATFTAVVAARHAAVGLDTSGLHRLTMYCSDQAHSSVVRAGWIAGIAREHVRAIPSDASFRMRADLLGEHIARDRRAGLQPFLVCATAGATNTGAVDPLPKIADICERESLWLHIDAAYAGMSMLTARGQELMAGLGRADTLTLDPHKWLYVPFECGCLLARDPATLESAFSVHPEYLRDVQVRDAEVNFADSGEQLTRYARALKIWFNVQYFGTAALAAAQMRGMALAELAERIVRDAPELEVLSPAQFGILCFRVHPDGLDDTDALNELNERVNTRVNRSGLVLMSSTRLREALSLRFCIPGHRTTEADVRAVLDLIRQTAAEELQ
jgi:glutamate/tyrosine decarboxylase-like PLP-dependent enzyme